MRVSGSSKVDKTADLMMALQDCVPTSSTAFFFFSDTLISLSTETCVSCSSVWMTCHEVRCKLWDGVMSVEVR